MLIERAYKHIMIMKSQILYKVLNTLLMEIMFMYIIIK